MFDPQSIPIVADPASDAYFDAVIIGAGFSGLYMLHRLHKLGLSARIYEASAGVGGTWYGNRYPGARTDSPSIHYSYSFSHELEQEWEWAEKYPTQPELLRYLNHVADRFDLRRDIQLETRVKAAVYDEAANRWRIETDKGDQIVAAFCITAVGCQSAANIPTLKGLDTFQGAVYHTSQWPHEGVDFTGKRVGVIGTAATGVQVIPHIAKQAAHLTVFQRTANYSFPARNSCLSAEEQAQIKANYRQIRQANRESRIGIALKRNHQSALEVTPEERQRQFEQMWLTGGQIGFLETFADVRRNLEANTYLADFVRAKIGEIVHDPDVAKLLMPHDHPIGSKRLCVDIGYYETYNRDNVCLVDIKQSPIEEVTPTGLRTQATEYKLDELVFATGFDAMTGTLLKIDIRGRNGLALKQKWADEPRAYLGIQTAGFPNLFMITGPGSPVLTHMPTLIEQHVDWIINCITYLRGHDVACIEPAMEAENAWVKHVGDLGDQTLYPLANCWYLGATIPGKPRVFIPYIGSLGDYAKQCEEIADNGYTGFILNPS